MSNDLPSSEMTDAEFMEHAIEVHGWPRIEHDIEQVRRHHDLIDHVRYVTGHYPEHSHLGEIKK